MSAAAPARHAAATAGTLPRRKAMAFLSLFFVPAVAQAILLTVVLLEALDLVGDARAVTLCFTSSAQAWSRWPDASAFRSCCD